MLLFLVAQPYLMPAMHAQPLWREADGFSLTELMVVLVIIGILALLALPRFTSVTTRAKMTEAKMMLRQVHTLQQAYFYERDVYGPELVGIGFEQVPLVTDGGTARYQISMASADERGFVARATAVIDFDRDGTLNVWTVDEQGSLREQTPD